MLNLIACIDKYNSIGLNNDLIYKFKDDLHIFKQKTINNTVIMGRKTFESLNNNPFELYFVRLEESKEGVSINKVLKSIENKNFSYF